MVESVIEVEGMRLSLEPGRGGHIWALRTKLETWVETVPKGESSPVGSRGLLRACASQGSIRETEPCR